MESTEQLNRLSFHGLFLRSRSNSAENWRKTVQRHNNQATGKPNRCPRKWQSPQHCEKLHKTASFNYESPALTAELQAHHFEKQHFTRNKWLDLEVFYG